MTCPDSTRSPTLTLIEVILPGSLAAICRTPTSDQVTDGPEILMGMVTKIEHRTATTIRIEKTTRKEKERKRIRDAAWSKSLVDNRLPAESDRKCEATLVKSYILIIKIFTSCLLHNQQPNTKRPRGSPSSLKS
jgi:hypothetical protein